MNVDEETDHERFVKDAISPGRWKHVRGVVQMADRLAETYPQLPVEPLRVAALFHDNARDLEQDAQRRLAEAYRGDLDPVEARTPPLWHAPAGAQRMVQAFDMDADAQAVRSVAFHSTGHPSLDPVLKGLLLADYVEPNRTFARAESLRDRIGSADLDELVRGVLHGKIVTCLERDLPIHPRGVEAYNALCD